MHTLRGHMAHCVGLLMVSAAGYLSRLSSALSAYHITRQGTNGPMVRVS